MDPALDGVMFYPTEGFQQPQYQNTRMQDASLTTPRDARGGRPGHSRGRGRNASTRRGGAAHGARTDIADAATDEPHQHQADQQPYMQEYVQNSQHIVDHEDQARDPSGRGRGRAQRGRERGGRGRGISGDRDGAPTNADIADVNAVVSGYVLSADAASYEPSVAFESGRTGTALGMGMNDGQSSRGAPVVRGRGRGRGRTSGRQHGEVQNSSSPNDSNALPARGNRGKSAPKHPAPLPRTLGDGAAVAEDVGEASTGPPVPAIYASTEREHRLTSVDDNTPQTTRDGFTLEADACAPSDAADVGINARGRRGGKRHDNAPGRGRDAAATFVTAPMGRGGGRGRESRVGMGPSGGQPAPKKRLGGSRGGGRADLSEASDRTTELIESLMANTCECMVCCELVGKREATYACTCCHVIFHMRCVQKWANSSMQPDAKGNRKDAWRCPGCQAPTTTSSLVYKCFCGKVRDPEWNPYLTPHSCGEPCLKPRPNHPACPHQCSMPCHPGPCPPCLVSVQQQCGCGKHSRRTRCSDNSGTWMCGLVCGKLLACGNHSCERLCHDGPCFECPVRETQGCYCGGSSRDAACGTGSPDAATEPPGGSVGYFSCGSMCSGMLSCGRHACERRCHAGRCGDCPLEPSVVKTCPCGSLAIEALTGKPRSICTDAVPTCGGVCGRPLSCSAGVDGAVHMCKARCHVGPCPPCHESLVVLCACGSTKAVVRCADKPPGDELCAPPCSKVCTVMRSCGRHQCNQRCCPGKLQSDPAHLCVLVCGKQLRCGHHNCEMLCHKGHCNQCLRAEFQEVSCRCGNAVILPPVPCGTPPPPCSMPCNREHPCSHPVRHACHSNAMCPPCVALVERRCVGGHEIRRNIPCHIQEVSCGKECMKLLSCGIHPCRRICHSGPCQEAAVVADAAHTLSGGLDRSGVGRTSSGDSSADALSSRSCGARCSLPLLRCNHPCPQRCHPGQPCPTDARACKHPTQVTCMCGRMTAAIPCTDAVRARSALSAAYAMIGGKMSDDGGAMQLRPNAALECDSACAAVERNRRLAGALEIEDANLSATPHPPYSEFLFLHAKAAKSGMQLVEFLEREYASLCNRARAENQPRHVTLPVMNQINRRVAHELAEAYCLQSESIDPEPSRSVAVTAIPSRSVVPGVLLSTLATYCPTYAATARFVQAGKSTAPVEVQVSAQISGKTSRDAWEWPDVANVADIYGGRWGPASGAAGGAQMQGIGQSADKTDAPSTQRTTPMALQESVRSAGGNEAGVERHVPDSWDDDVVSPSGPATARRGAPAVAVVDDDTVPADWTSLAD